jgi:hypothetical protein
MTAFVQSTVADAAEHAIRAHLEKCDQPLQRMEALARELFLAFRDAAGGSPDTTAHAELAAGFRIAVDRLWAECGGDPSCVPRMQFPVDGTPDPTPWPGHVLPQ